MVAVRTMPKATVAEVLRHVGYPADQVNELLDQLADPVDFERDAPVLDRYGVDRNHLTDRMGGSP
jgi:hypothetical protein